MSDKKHEQLGMNPSTASGRLVKDLLYKLVVDTGQNNCFVCQKPMTRETFSIEHKIPWLDSEDLIKLYFDTSNISFSHLVCNVGNARRLKRVSEEEQRIRHARADRESKRRNYSAEKRRQRYLDKGY